MARCTGGPGNEENDTSASLEAGSAGSGWVTKPPQVASRAVPAWTLEHARSTLSARRVTEGETCGAKNAP